MADDEGVKKLSMSLDDIIAASSKPARTGRTGRRTAPKVTAQAQRQGPRKGLRANRKETNTMDIDAPAKQPNPKSLADAPPLGTRVNRRKRAPVLAVRQKTIQKPKYVSIQRAALAPAPRVLAQQARQAPRQLRATQAPARAQQAVRQAVRPRAVQQAPLYVAPAQERQAKQAALEGDQRWQHDKYEHGTAPLRRAPVQQAQLSTKLILSNLHWNVTPADILELFSVKGTVTEHGVNFDSSGRSVGTGFVLFSSRKEAEAAKKAYEDVTLDGKKLQMEFADSVSTSVPSKLQSGIKVGRDGAPAPQLRGASQGSAAARLLSQGMPTGRTDGRRLQSSVRRAAADSDYMEM